MRQSPPSGALHGSFCDRKKKTCCVFCHGLLEPYNVCDRKECWRRRVLLSYPLAFVWHLIFTERISISKAVFSYVSAYHQLKSKTEECLLTLLRCCGKVVEVCILKFYSYISNVKISTGVAILLSARVYFLLLQRSSLLWIMLLIILLNVEVV